MAEICGPAGDMSSLGSILIVLTIDDDDCLSDTDSPSESDSSIEIRQDLDVALAGTSRRGDRWRSFPAFLFLRDGVGGAEGLTGYATGEDIRGRSNEGGEDGSVGVGGVRFAETRATGWLDGTPTNVNLLGVASERTPTHPKIDRLRF